MLFTKAERELKEYTTSDFFPLIKAMVFSAAGFFYLEIMVPQFAELLDLSGIQIGIFFSLRTIGYLFGALIAGYITDKFSKSAIALYGTMGRSVSYLILYIGILMRSYPIVIVGGLILGFSVSFVWIPVNALLSQKSHSAHRSKVFAQKNFAMGVGMIIGGLIGFALLQVAISIDETILWLKFSAFPLYIVSNFISAFLIKSRTSEDLIFDEGIEVEIDDGAPEIVVVGKLEEKRYAFNFTKVALFGFIFFLISYFLTAVNTNISKPFIQFFIMFDVVDDEIAMLFVYFPAGIISILTQPLVGRMIDKKPLIHVTIVASLLGSFTTVLLMNTTNLLLFTIFLTFDYIFGMATGLVLSNFISRISKKHRGKIFGITDFTAQFGGIIGPIIGGIVWDTMGHKWPFYISVVVEMMIIPFLILSYKKIQSELDE